MPSSTDRVAVVLKPCDKILRRIENAIGLNVVIDGVNIETADIDTFLKYLKTRRQSLPEGEELFKDSTALQNQLATLCYVSSYASFHRIVALDFSTHARVDFLATFLYPYLLRENIVKGVQKTTLKIISYLQVLEQHHPNIVRTMNYRYIRLFLLFVENGYLFNASILARFIIDQIFISSAVDNSVNIKLEELNAVAKKLDKLAKEYKKPAGKYKTSSSAKSSMLNRKPKVDPPHNSYASSSEDCKTYEDYQKAQATGATKTSRSSFQSINKSGAFHD